MGGQQRGKVERNKLIRQERITATITSLAQKYSLSKQRIHQICQGIQGPRSYKYHKTEEERQEARRQSQRKATAKSNRKYRREAIKALGGECQKCGFDDHRALQFDHINGRGYLDQRHLPFYIHKDVVKKKNRKKYQLLCANCNWVKRSENNEQPYRHDEGE